MRALRYLFATATLGFVLGVAVQVFLAGMFLFAGGLRATHIDFGYTLTLVPPAILLLAFLARAGRRTIGLSVALLAVTWLQPTLVYFRNDMPIIAALHPVNAMVLFGLGVIVARRAVALARASNRAPQPLPAGGAVTGG
jgi:hypothetical protein